MKPFSYSARLFTIALFLSVVFVTGCGGRNSGSTPPPTIVQAATPTFSVAAGTYISAQVVTIADATPGSAIYYTTDGTTPTAASKSYTTPVTISTSTTLQAIATATGSTTSTVATATFAITLPAVTPTFSSSAGTYTSVQSITITDATSGAIIYYTTDNTTPTIASKPYTGPITLSSDTTLQAIAVAPGATASAIATAAYIIRLPAATPIFSLAAGTYTSAQTVTIADANAGSTIFYTTDGSVPTAAAKLYTGPITISSNTTLQALANTPGSTASAIATATYIIVAAVPTISPVAGTYTAAQMITITDTSPGAAIYYTTDGSAPTKTSNVYTAAIPVSTTQIISAVASLNGQLSHPTTASYVINVPSASLAAFSGGGQNVQVGNGFPLPLQIQALDSGGRPAVGTVVSFSTPLAGPSLSLSTSTCTTDNNGLCSVIGRANSSVGTYTVTASTATLDASFTLTNTGLHSYIVTLDTDTTTGVATNCLDQASASGSANSTCSLRDALSAAALSATSAQNATITFSQSAPATITLANGPLNIPSYTTIQGSTSGSGATLTNLVTVDGNNATTVFTEAAGVTQAAINNLTIAHGLAPQVGGGILMKGSLAVNNCTLAANQSAVSGGAISNSGGALSVFGSTFANNVAQSGYGGALDNYGVGTMTVSNSTFSGNHSVYGGAIYNSGQGTPSTTAITASTISANTATTGGGIYNLGAMTIGSSIVNGNTPVDCEGIYCSPLWAYVVFASATPTVVDSSNITIAFSDSDGNSFSQTVVTGPFSFPASIAAAFGPYFYYNTSTLDTAPITGQSFGNLLVITPLNGATLNPFNITNPGRSFTAAQMFYPLLLSVNQNISGATATQIHLSPLGNNGGPTQTMVPLSGSTALCVISPSSGTGTDQRGEPRVATLGTTTCQDAGAVQTSN